MDYNTTSSQTPNRNGIPTGHIKQYCTVCMYVCICCTHTYAHAYTYTLLMFLEGCWALTVQKLEVKQLSICST